VTKAENSESKAAQFDAVIVGAGLAGLACARELLAAGLTVQILEAADAAGGENSDGFGGRFSSGSGISGIADIIS